MDFFKRVGVMAKMSPIRTICILSFFVIIGACRMSFAKVEYANIIYGYHDSVADNDLNYNWPYGGFYGDDGVNFTIDIDLNDFSFVKKDNNYYWLSLPKDSYVILGVNGGFGIGDKYFDTIIFNKDYISDVVDCEMASLYVTNDLVNYSFVGFLSENNSILTPNSLMDGSDLVIRLNAKYKAVKIVGMDNGGDSPGFDITSIGFSSISPSLIDPIQAGLVKSNPWIQAPVNSNGFDTLATYNKVIQGVAADGVAQAIVRIPTIKDDESLTVSILNDQGQLSSSSSEDGGLITFGTDGDLASSSNELSSINIEQTSVGTMAFATYIAPLDFVRQGNQNDPTSASRDVTIQVTSSLGWQTSTTVRIVRPPVVLVHGLWSNPAAWNCFPPLVPMPGNLVDNRFIVSKADYSQTNYASFAQNAPIVLSQVKGAINWLKKTSNVAAVQADMVAHSMGGNIARRFVLLPDYLSKDTFGKGIVHKLITLDTPYTGSRLANNLLQESDTCKYILSKAEMKVAGAITDLAVGSQELLALQSSLKFPIPAHAIAGIASNAQTATAEGNYWKIKKFCSTVLPTGNFVDLFNGPSDLIVSQASQQGVGTGYFVLDPPPDIIQGFIHSADSILFTLGPDILNRVIDSGQGVCINTGVGQRVIDLLNSPMQDGAFQAIRP